MKKTEIESIIKIKRKESRMSRHHRTYSTDEKKKQTKQSQLLAYLGVSALRI